MKYLTFLMIIIFFTIPLYSYEFIQSYFPDSNAVALSAVENGRGGYVVLIGVKWGSWWDNIGYGIMEVDSMGNYERYVRIFHGGSKGVEVGKYPFRTVDSIGVKGYKDGSASDRASGKIIRLRSGGYFAAVDSVYCYWDWFSHEVICEDHLIGFRINDDLGVEWRRNYPASGYVDELRESEDKSGDIIILSGFNVDFIRIDSVGNIKVDVSYGTRGCMGDIIENTKGGYVLCGGGYIRGLDSTGNIEWERDYDSMVYTMDRIVRAKNGGYLIAGNAGGGRSGYLMMVDDSGVFNWIRYYDNWDGGFGVDFIVSLYLVADGYVVVVQTNDSCASDTLNPLKAIGIVKVDSIGNLEWERKFYRCPHEDRYPRWSPLDGKVVNNGYLISGYHGAYDNIAVLIKTDSLGLVDEVGENIFISSITGPDYVISSRRELTELFKGSPGIKIYDLSGREIKLKTSVSTIRRGVYLYEDKRRRERGLLLLLVK